MRSCPDCGSGGLQVKRVTLESLLRPERRANISERPYRVCTTPDCEIVYFSSDGKSTFSKSDLTVRFGLKETGAPRPVCYCFNHTAEEIEEEISRTGSSAVVERIKSEMAGNGCRCERTNPIGKCCIKSVEVVVAESLKSVGRELCIPKTPSAALVGTDGGR